MKPTLSLMLLVAALMLPAAASASDKAVSKKSSMKASSHSAAPKTAEEPAVPLAAADPEQMLAANQVYLGRYDCEYGQILTVSRHNGVDGYVDVEVMQRKGTFKPVRSSTGAVRLEEVTAGGLLLLQIPSKSILMDTKAGKRLIDGCRCDEQKRFDALAKAGDNNLGINAPGQIAVTGTPTMPPVGKN